MITIIGIDPGLQYTGWGIIQKENNNLIYVANGTIKTNPKDNMADRLKTIHNGLLEVLQKYTPDQAAIEETFVNVNAKTSLKLGQARGVALLTPALNGVEVFEYSPNLIKKSIACTGHASKEQVQMMIGVLLPKCDKIDSEHSADALAGAICHANHSNIF